MQGMPMRDGRRVPPLGPFWRTVRIPTAPHAVSTGFSQICPIRLAGVHAVWACLRILTTRARMLHSGGRRDVSPPSPDPPIRPKSPIRAEKRQPRNLYPKTARPGRRPGRSAPGPRCRIGDGATVGLGVYCQRPDRVRRAGAAEGRRRQTANERGTERLSATVSSAHTRKIRA